jgi:hypothetical protein
MSDVTTCFLCDMLGCDIPNTCVAYVMLQKETGTIAERGPEHDSGNSGASLEGPVSFTSKQRGIQAEVTCLFQHDVLLEVASAVESELDKQLHVVLGMVYNFAEAVGCGLLRSHVADVHEGALGTNATAGGQVFGPASQRVNTVINNIRSSYTKAVAERKIDEPAVVHAQHDAGLMVSLFLRGITPHVCIDRL